MYFSKYTVVCLISILENWRQNIRPTSTEYDPETSDAENEIERLQSRYRRLKYKIQASLKESRKQEKIINQLQLKLEHDKLKIQVIKNEMGSLIRKFKFVTPVLIAIIIATTWQVKSGYENELKSCEHENHKYEKDLQDKQKELQALNERYNRLEIENRRLQTENQKYKDDLKEAFLAERSLTKRSTIMNVYHDDFDHRRFDFIGNHTRLVLVQHKTFEKIVLQSDNNAIYEYEFQLKVRYF